MFIQSAITSNIEIESLRPLLFLDLCIRALKIAENAVKPVDRSVIEMPAFEGFSSVPVTEHKPVSACTRKS